MGTLAELEPVATSVPAYAFAILLGLLWGSFANVCIYRWPPSAEFPKGRSVVKPGSHCFSCGAPVRWYDNVPLLSYLWLRGACRDCKTTFSARYLVVEALTGALFGVAWWAAISANSLFEPFDQRLLRFVVYAAFIVLVVVIAFIDLDTKLILDKVAYPAIPVFYVIGLLLPGQRWFDGLVGAAIGYGLPWTIGWVFWRITRREGLGLGDASFLAIVGALLGWQGVVVSLFGGSVVGTVIALPVLVARRKSAPPEPQQVEPLAGSPQAPADEDDQPDEPPSSSFRHQELPFGPFLAIAAVFYMFAQPWISLHLRFGGG